MTRRAATDLAVLAALGAGVVALAAWTATWPLARARPGGFALAVLGQLALVGLAALWVHRRRPPARAALVLVIAVGAAALAVLVPVAPDVSGDVNRYVWDGRVQAEGINPYRHAPSDPALAALRDEAVYPGINRKGVPTIYPPAAQGAFAAVHLVTGGGVAAFKLAMAALALALALVVAWLLRACGRHPALALLVAWHPLVLLEVGRSGHIDVLATLLLVAALGLVVRRPLRAGALVAAATLVKLYAVVALPALMAGGGRRALRVPLVAAGVAALLYAPYLGVGADVLGYLPGYLGEEGYSSGSRYHLASRLGVPAPALVWPLVTAAALAAIALYAWRAPAGGTAAVVDRALLLILVATVMTTPTYPWYALPLVALAPLARPALAVPAAVVGGAAPLLYLQWWLPGGATWPLDLVWLGGAGALAAGTAVALGRRRAGRPSPARAWRAAAVHGTDRRPAPR